MIATEEILTTTAPTSVVLESLVYETLGGRDLYYRGYKEVLIGKKTKEEIMASSSLQSTLVTLIVLFLGGCINRRKYLLSSSETGLHLSKNDNLGLDIAIFDKRTLTPLNEKYFNIPPKIVIEVDVKVDISLADFPAKEMDYIFDKSQKLLDSGVEKVVWVTTHTKKIFIASKTQTWIVIDWFTDFELIEGYTLNIKQILDNEEIDY
jgi:Uma2 family endonuclease